MIDLVSQRCTANDEHAGKNSTYGGGSATMASPRRHFFPYFFFIFLLVMTMTADCVYSQRPQYSRRPTGSPALEAYRNRWMAYLNSKTSTTSTTKRPLPVRIRGGSEENSGPTVNGFQCQRVYTFFSDAKNPRMYHLCARARDNWFVYHYFCPHGTVFNDGMKKCVQSRDEVIAPTSRPGVNKPAVPQVTTTTTTTTTQRPTPSSTSEEPQPAPEPDSDHNDATENTPSSEEVSNEESIDVVVSGPLSPIESVDERVEQEAHEHIEEQLNMIIPENEVANEESRLPVASPPSSTPATTTSSSPKQTVLKRVPLKRIKVPSSDSAVDESPVGENTSLNERRPRILKKIKYWRDFLVGQ